MRRSSRRHRDAAATRHVVVAAAALATGCGAGEHRVAVGDRGTASVQEELDRFGDAARRFVAVAEGARAAELRRLGVELRALYAELGAREGSRLDSLRERALQLADERRGESPLAPRLALEVADLHLRLERDRFEAAMERYADELERGSRGQDPEPPEPSQDNGRAIELLRGLLEGSPDPTERVEALYMLGFAAHQVDDVETALDAWRRIVCPNGRRPADASEDEGDPFVGCEPIAEDSGLVAEVWLRIAEHHFEGVASEELDLAAAAYERARRAGPSPFGAVASYKLAWCHYRSDHFPEAIGTFLELVDAAGGGDEEAGLFRAEALLYAAISLAEEDWDADGRPDGAAVVDRLRDPALVPPDQGYAPELDRLVGDVLYDMARYGEAIDVYDHHRSRWPRSDDGPHVAFRIVAAHEARRDFDRAAEERSRAVAAWGEPARSSRSEPEAATTLDPAASYRSWATRLLEDGDGRAVAAVARAVTAYEALVSGRRRALAETRLVEPELRALLEDGEARAPRRQPPGDLEEALRVSREAERRLERRLALLASSIRRIDESLARTARPSGGREEPVVSVGRGAGPFTVIPRRPMSEP